FINFFNHHLYLTIAAIIIFALLALVEILRAKRNVREITPSAAIQLINHEQGVVIDIRAPEQYRKGHIIDAVSILPSELSQAGKKIEKYKANPLIIVCNAGISSLKTATHLAKEGYQVYSL